MKDLKFEEALAKLEEIVRQLETGELPLEDSLKLFESGVALARLCSKKLDEAEGKIQILLSEDGEPTREEFAVEEDAL
ncbi:MAG TPA: exodeoxyribonuclease VII small subunit [Firmicutes bacterium]|nr:MAG: exodeoxyribonuclease VII small subunit [Peptococcaceae bacterium 1109]HHT72745.1 exodeoxyribonuclease VII small subunit [Bacillota bacterium]